MQLAVASYVCPADSNAISVAKTAMPCEGEMVADTEQVALCHAHCQPDQKSVEKSQTHSPMGAATTGVTYPIETAEVDRDRSIPQSYMPSQLRSTAPPMAIRNCCFRI